MNQKVLPYIKKGNAFVAVGLAHLLGENGMINFLKAKGYNVELKSFSAQYELRPGQ